MRQRIRRAVTLQKRGMERGIMAFAEAVVSRAKEPDQTPVLTGALRNSIHADGPDWVGRTLTAEVVSGGPSAPYGGRVHEDFSMNHPRGGKAKFLEDPLNELSPQATQIIGEYVDLK